MGGRDHSYECDECGLFRGGLNDLACDCAIDALTEPNPENLKLSAGKAKPPLSIVPFAALVGASRVLEDGGAAYAPGNFLAQALEAALASYDSAQLRHRLRCQPLNGIVTAASFAALDDDSGLPHVDHMIAGLLILRTLMIRDGVLPEDPGVGKRKAAKSAPPVQQVIRFDDAGRCNVDGDAVDPETTGDFSERQTPVLLTTSIVSDELAHRKPEDGPERADNVSDKERFRGIDQNIQRLQTESRHAAEDKRQRDLARAKGGV